MNNTILPKGTVVTVNGKTGTVVGMDDQRGALSSGQYIIRWSDGRQTLASVRVVKAA